jgi:hypothetical protein
MKKIKYISILFSLLFCATVQAQLKIGDNPNTISSSSVLEMESTNKGMLVPRMTSIQRTAIATPALGLLVYDNVTNSFWQFNGTVWEELSNYWVKTGNDISNTNTGNVGINTVTPNAYGHGGVNKILEVFNNNTGANNQTHLMLSTNGTSGSTGGITWASPALTSVDKRTGFIGNLHEGTSTAASPISSLTFYTTNAGALSEKVRINNAGNVGIGNSTPGFPLNFASTLGDKISLYGNTGSHYGLGIQPGLLQMHTDIATSNIAFGYGSSASFTERARIVNSGTEGMYLNGRLHLRNGSIPLDVNQTPGVWLYRADNSALLGFMGTQNNNNIGFYGGSSGWGFTYDAINSNVGINNNSPSEKLDIVGKIKITDGSQGVDRVLKSDANGVGTWVTSTATKAAQVGVFSGAGATLSSTTYVYTGAYIDLPYGKWSINGTYLIAGASFPSANSSVWIRTSFSDGTTGTYPANVSPDIQGSVLISGTLISPNIYGVINGQIIIQNNVPNTVKRYYMWASLERFGSTPGTYNISGFANTAAENQMIAYPMN